MVVEQGKPEVVAASSAKRRLVLKITRMTVHNGPGIRTLIQFKGCPLRCIWCSTPESQRSVPEIALYPDRCIHCDQCLPVCHANAITLTDTAVSINRAACDGCGKCTTVCYAQALRLLGQEMTVEELLVEVEKDSVAYKHSGGGVTLSGGEPLLEPEFACTLLQCLSEREISVGVDTCGYVPQETVKRVLPYVAFFLWDLKLMDDRRHRQSTGVSNKLILDNLRLVSEKGVPVYIRIPVIPGYNDSEQDLVSICEFARGLPSLVEIDLLPLHHLGKARYASLDRHYPIDGIPLIPDEALQQMRILVESHGVCCNIVG